MKTLIIGCGEVGSALNSILSRKYSVDILDPNLGMNPEAGRFDIIHICFPYSDNFISMVELYAERFCPRFIVIHSSVAVGTCDKIRVVADVIHSPVRGMHPNMASGLMTYVKYLSSESGRSSEVASYFNAAGVKCREVRGTRITELSKLLELSRYGVYLAFAKEQEAICNTFGVRYEDVVTDYEKTRSEGLNELNLGHLSHPILTPFENYVGGHCTVEDMEILLKQNVTPLLEKSYEIDRNTKIWGNCNIYPTAKIGKGCSIGSGTEIGDRVKIGNNVRIGAQCFIPEGVTIEDDCFIAPKVSFSNDKYPPSGDKAKWGRIIVKKGAAVGMGAIVLPDVTIGENALIGAGSIVTHDVPAGEKVYGNPAHSHGRR